MKKELDGVDKKKRGNSRVGKGAPSGFVISLLFHIAAFFIAGLFVVFTVVNKKEPEFVPPPPVERPRMTLKKPKVKVQKSSQPKPSSRIVAKVKSREMPEIQLPDIAGTGDGLLNGVGIGAGEFMDLPEIGKTSLFGGGQTSGNDLRVSFYNLNLKHDGSTASMNPDMYKNVIMNYLERWNKSVLEKYYRSPKTLYASTVMIPLVVSAIGPEAFGEDLNYGYCWCALYEGKLVYKEDITFRFWGAADDVMSVAVDNKLVLQASYPTDMIARSSKWTTHAPSSTAFLGNLYRVGGDWITLKAGEPRDLKVIVGECPGGQFHAQLLVEVQGEEYPLNKKGNRLFPVFTTEPLSWAMQDTILFNLVEGDANVTNVTTIFRDY